MEETLGKVAHQSFKSEKKSFTSYSASVKKHEFKENAIWV